MDENAEHVNFLNKLKDDQIIINVAPVDKDNLTTIMINAITRKIALVEDDVKHLIDGDDAQTFIKCFNAVTSNIPRHRRGNAFKVWRDYNYDIGSIGNNKLYQIRCGNINEMVYTICTMDDLSIIFDSWRIKCSYL